MIYLLFDNFVSVIMYDLQKDSQKGDMYEEEAEQVADAVMQMPESPVVPGDAFHLQPSGCAPYVRWK
jgi:hypothetical protein